MTLSSSLRPAAILTLVVATAMLMGCDTSEPEPERPAAELDLETLEAETEFGPLQAERVDDSYVTAMGEGRVLGIALLGEGDAEQDSLIAYLYDRDDLSVLRGELSEEGEAALESTDQSDFDATLELTVDGEAASGAASFLDQEDATFTAEVAAGVAGVYWAEGTPEDPNVGGSWVVLPDERQWGCACLPPFTSPCCSLPQ